MFLRIFKHLLPRSRAWIITIEKTLRQFFEGLAAAIDPHKEYYDDIYDDIFPQTTRELERWEKQFGLPTVDLTIQQRRDRLEATWKAMGGQSPRYIQDTLQGAGFDVYVHEWWVPGTEPPVGTKGAATARNPFSVLFPTSAATQSTVECGEPLAECGEPTAECGNVFNTLGYPLVNKILRSVSELLVLCGEPFAECGEPAAECGERAPIEQKPVVYAIPQNPDKWPYFLYIGASTFGDLASLPKERRNEFEELILKIGPAQQWLGMLVVYT